MYRTGTTSYIVPADILPNVDYLAPLVDDVELVLFETDAYGSNLPDAGICAELRALAVDHALTYTVHLPLDLRLAEGGAATDESLVKARRVIEVTRSLDPYAYVVHLDGRELLDPPLSPDGLERWQANARGALAAVCSWLDDPRRLAVENIERWDPAAFAPLIGELGISRTADVGHLWLAGLDPLPVLDEWLPDIRVVHLHGIAERDHQSLVHVPPERLDPVIDVLNRRFDGVLTLEVFAQMDLDSSLAALRAAEERVLASRPFAT